ANCARRGSRARRARPHRAATLAPQPACVVFCERPAPTVSSRYFAARGSAGGVAMPDIRAMCAIGRRGQLGLNGRMPWEGARGPEYTADVRRFFELTRGHVILLGPRTYRSVPAFAHEDRTVVAIRSSEQPPDVIARYPDRVIYIG